MRRMLACVVLAVMVAGCDAEDTSEADKTAEDQKASEVQKEVEQPPEAPAPKLPSQVDMQKTFEDGAAAYKSGDYATALRLLGPIAELGAAPAQLTVGLMYAEGKGVQQDYTEALKWYRLAAEQGNADAQMNLGNLYLQGLGILPDDTEAAKWFTRAAEQGNSKAQNNLGVMYATGRGVPQDSVQAYKWFSLAATSERPEDRDNGVNNRDRIGGQMTQEQVAQAQKLAQEWQPMPAAATAGQ